MDFAFLFSFVGAVLSSLYDIHASYGFVIIVVTLLALVMTTPLTLKATRSMLLLRRLQPELRALQARHRDDRQRLNEELRRFYGEHGITPLSGCVPQLVPMGVFAVLSAVLHGLVRHATTAGAAAGWVIGHRAFGPRVPAVPALVPTFDPTYLPPGQLADHLHAASTLPWLGIDLADSLQGVVLTHGIPASLPHLALVAVVALTAFFQQRQGRSMTAPSPVDPTQRLLASVSPFFVPLMAVTLPAGLVLYLAVSNLWRLGQQAALARWGT